MGNGHYGRSRLGGMKSDADAEAKLRLLVARDADAEQLLIFY
jgi:hypothetical protein